MRKGPANASPRRQRVPTGGFHGGASRVVLPSLLFHVAVPYHAFFVDCWADSVHAFRDCSDE